MGVYEVTVHGKDAGGFAFENVFHVSTDYAGPDSDFITAGHLVDHINTELWSSWASCMNDSSELLACSARLIGSSPGFTHTKPFPLEGGRALAAAVGAVCGRLVFLPTASALHVSSLFISNACDGDFLNDIITSTYKGLLEALGDAFLLLDGSEGTYHWQLVQWHAKTSTSSNIDEYYASPNPSTLNKRIRA